jgi:hemerythrin
VSTAHVGDQQWDHYHAKIVSLFSPSSTAAAASSSKPIAELPTVLVELISSYARHGFTHDEALEIRRQLMVERKYFIDQHNDAWERSYSLCEH